MQGMSGNKPAINRWSTGRCVPPSVYIRFRLFVLLESRSGDVFSDALESTRDACLLAELFCQRAVLAGPSPPPCRAPRPDPPVVCPGFSRTCLARKGFTKTKRRRSTGQQPGTKSARGLADKPRINRSSTADFVPAFGLHRISLVRASGETFRRRVFDALEGTGVPCFLGEQFCWHAVLHNPAPPPRCAPRPDPPVVCPGFGLDRWTRQVPG